MKVLIACEYSGRVRDAFINKGHDVISCDLLPTDKPGPHYQGRVEDLLLNNGYCNNKKKVKKMIIDGKVYEVEQVGVNTFRLYGEEAINHISGLRDLKKPFPVGIEFHDLFLATVINILTVDRVNGFIEAELINISEFPKKVRLKEVELHKPSDWIHDFRIYFDNNYAVGISIRNEDSPEKIANNLRAMAGKIDHIEK